MAEPDVVLEAALRFVEVRQRSVADVRRRLLSSGFRPELVDGAIVRLADLGILDDEAFSVAWVESRDRARPRGERALRMELARKGVDRQTADETIAGPEADQPDADAEAARLLARNARALDRIPDLRSRRQRACALLARNGFNPEVASSAAHALGDTAPNAEEPWIPRNVPL